MASKTFDNENPGRNVHNPNSVGSGQHLYRRVDVARGDALPDGTLIVAWKGKEPIHNEILDVQDEDAKAAALKDGWSESPVVPKAEKAEKKGAKA